MSTQTVVDVVISGSTTTVVDKRIDGVTTVAGEAPVTNVSGQVPDLGVNTDILATQGDILSLTNDVANLRANLIVTGTSLTDEIGVLSGVLISTGNQLNFTINNLSGDLIATGNSLDSLREILSGNLLDTGQNLQNQITSNDVDIARLEDSTGDLQLNKFDKIGGAISGNIVPSASGTLSIGTPELPFLSGYFQDITISSNTLFIGDVPIHSSNGGIDFLSATGETFFKDVTIRNLTVTGTETIIDVEHLAVKDNTITLNTGETGAGISLITGGLIIDRGSLTDADILFNEENDRFEFNFPVAIQGSPVITQGVTGSFVTQAKLSETGNTLESQVNTVDDRVDSLVSNLGNTGTTLTNSIDSLSGTTNQSFLSTGSIVDSVSGNLISTGANLQTQVNNISTNVGTTGQTLQSQITSNLNNLQSVETNLITTGQTLTNKINSDISTVSSNLATTGQTLSADILTVSGEINQPFDELSGNLITTGQTLQAQITTNDTGILENHNNIDSTGVLLLSNINTVSSNLVSTGSIADDISGNLITTGQSLQADIAIVSGIATGGSSQDFRELSGNLITTGQTLQGQITSNNNDISDLSGNLSATGQTLTSLLVQTGDFVDTLSGNLIITGNLIDSEITVVSGLVVQNDGDISTLQTATGTLKTLIDTDSANLISTGNFLNNEIAIVSGIAGGQDVTALSGRVNTLSGNLITTGQTLQTQVTSNDSDITNLTSNLITTGQTLTSEIAIVSGLTTGSSSDPDLSGKVDTLSGNLITTGQTLQTQITSNDSDITNLTSNLVTTGQTLTTDITTVSGLIVDNDGDITALKTATGVLKTSTDSNTANLITTGQTLQTQITSNDGDISTLTTNLGTTGQTLQTQITSNDSDISTLTSNLITTGQTLTTDISTVSGLITDNDADIAALRSATGVLKTSTDANTTNLITTGQTLQTQITSNDGDITTLTSNLVTTGQTLQTQITSNDSDISTLTTNIGTTGQTLQAQITSNDSDITNLTSNLITTGQTLTTDINTVSGLITDNDADITALKTATGVLKTNSDSNTANLITTGQTLQTQITSNDGDITTLTSNLATTGQTLTTNVNTVSTNLISTGAIVDDISGNLITTGQTLQTQITSNDGDITTLTSNLVTTGQTLTTNINTVATNLGTSGQTLQTQITSNDSDISTLTSNLGTTGQTLQTQITSNDSDIASLTTNLGTTGQTLQTQITSNDSDISTLDSTTVKLTTNQSIAGNKIFTNDVTINNLTVTGTEVVVDVENLAVKDNIIEINSGESGAGISRISGGIVIDRGTATDANILYNDANDRFELNFPLAVEGEVVASASNLITTGQTLTTNINTVSTNLGTSGQTLQTQITSNDSDISTLTTNLGTTGQTLQTQITSNDSDISTLTTNLGTSGQTLQTQITSNDSDISTLTTNIGTTGQTLQTQITSNDSDISTLTSNLVTTGQTLTTNINTVSTNLGTSGQTLQTQITSNDTDITNLSSNLVTTGQTLTTNINTVATNLVTTGQTLTSEIATVSGLIPATVIDGGGTANKVPLWSDANTIGDSVISQSSSKIGIGTAAPTSPLTIKSSSTSATDSGLTIQGNSNTNAIVKIAEKSTDGARLHLYDGGVEKIAFYTDGTANHISAGSVGIGTNNPGEMLQVGDGSVNSTSIEINSASWAQLKLTSPNTNGAYIMFGDPEDEDIGNIFYYHGSNANYMSFTTNASEQMRIDKNGNVGIGTNAPAYALDVRSAGATTLQVKSAGNSDDTQLKLQSNAFFFNITNEGAGGNITYVSDDAQDQIWYTDNASNASVERFRIEGGADVDAIYFSNSKVGIGTNAPVQPLHVLGDAMRFERANNAVALQLYNNNASPADGAALGYLQFMGKDNDGTASIAHSEVRGGVQSNTDSAVSGYLSFLTTNNATSVTEAMRIKADGNVGIGLTDPDAKLEIKGGGASTGLTLKTTDSSGNTGFWVQDGGKVGVHYYPFVVNQDYNDTDCPSNTYMYVHSASPFIIKNDGSVGIGTVSPSAKLHVYTSATLYQLWGNNSVVRSNTGSHGLRIYNNDSGGSSLVVQDDGGSNTPFIVKGGASGSVGIGTVSPECDLDLHKVAAGGLRLNIHNSAVETTSDASITFETQGQMDWGMGIDRSDSGKFKIGHHPTVGSDTVLTLVPQNDRVGIGTVTPSSKLHVNSEISCGADDNNRAMFGYTPSRFYLGTRQSGTNYLNTVNVTSGKVGIGVVDPDQSLEVAGAIKSTGAYGFYAGRADTTWASFGSGVPTILLRGSLDNSRAGAVQFKEYDGTDTAAIYSTDGTDGYGLVMAAYQGDMKFATGSLTGYKMVILGNGNVGIGTDAPSRPLHVYVTSGNNYLTVQNTSVSQAALQLMTGTTDANWVMYIPSSSTDLRLYRGADKVVFKADGNVGIGISPTTRLQVKDSVDNSYESGISIVRSADGATTWLNVRGGATNFNNKNHAGNAGLPYRWFQNGTQALKIESAGGIQIGADGTARELRWANTFANNGPTIIGHDVNGTFQFYPAGNNSGEVLKLASNGAVTFNQVFTFPTADGSAGQVLQTNGSGTVTWATVSGGGGVSGSGTDHYIPRWNGTTALQDSSIIALDSGSVGIGVATPVAKLTLPLEEENGFKIAFKAASGDGHAGLSTVDQSGAGLMVAANTYLNASGTPVAGNSSNPSLGIYFDGWSGDRMKFVTAASGNPAERMCINAAGKVIINDTATTNNNNAQLYVNGPVYGSEFDLPSGGVVDWANGDARIAEGLSSNYSLSLQNYDGSSAMVTTMFLKSGGNVGIGTVAPAAHLHVSKAAGTTTVLTQVAANSTVGFEIKKTGSTTQHWKIVDGQTVNGTLEFYDATDSATRMAINGNGSVGIGTASPNDDLNIHDSSASANLGIKITRGTQTHGLRIGVNDSHAFVWTDQSQSLAFATNNTERLTILSGGSVGIGTNAPAANLHIYEATTDTPLQITRAANTGNAMIKFETGSTDDWIVGLRNDSTSNFRIYSYGTSSDVFSINRTDGNVGIGTNAPAAKLESYITSGGEKGLRLNSNFSGGNAVDFIPAVVGVSNAGFSIDLAGTTRFVINDGGNVGIGTNSPLDKLDVYGSGAVFRNLSDNADSVQIVRGTNHTASPDAKFYIYDNSSADWAAKINLDGASYGLDITGGVNYFLLCRDASGNRMFEVHSTSVVVNDGSTDMDFRVEGNGDDYLLYTDGGNDRVAVSTNSPAAKLHVEGDFKVGTTNNGNWMGYKDVTLNGTTYTTALTINLANHTGCYVKLFLTGDWSSHSAVAFVGEYFVQNGGDGYAEPGTVISEFDNTNTDSIESKIVDPSSDTFTIQLKLSTAANGTLGGKLSYHVMGMATAVS
jgi:hypothetical protein